MEGFTPPPQPPSPPQPNIIRRIVRCAAVGGGRGRPQLTSDDVAQSRRGTNLHPPLVLNKEDEWRWEGDINRVWFKDRRRRGSEDGGKIGCGGVVVARVKRGLHFILENSMNIKEEEEEEEEK
jgi:hypothetical protein